MSTSTEGPLCKLCGKTVHKPRMAWREARGYVSPTGAKAMTGMTMTGEIAHPECINLLRAGVPIGQLDLDS
jgi:hypothetical protein